MPELGQKRKQDSPEPPSSKKPARDPWKAFMNSRAVNQFLSKLATPNSKRDAHFNRSQLRIQIRYDMSDKPREPDWFGLDLETEIAVRALETFPPLNAFASAMPSSEIVDSGLSSPEVRKADKALREKTALALMKEHKYFTCFACELVTAWDKHVLPEGSPSWNRVICKYCSTDSIPVEDRVRCCIECKEEKPPKKFGKESKKCDECVAVAKAKYDEEWGPKRCSGCQREVEEGNEKCRRCDREAARTQRQNASKRERERPLQTVRLSKPTELSPAEKRQKERQRQISDIRWKNRFALLPESEDEEDDNGARNTVPKPVSVEVNGEAFVIYQVLASRIYHGKLQYNAVCMQGSLSDVVCLEGSPRDTFLDASVFAHCPTLLQQFHEQNPNTPGPPKSLHLWLDAEKVDYKHDLVDEEDIHAEPARHDEPPSCSKKDSQR